MKKLVLLLSLFAVSCFAEPIQFIVSASAGGPMDTVSRKIAEQLEKNTNSEFVVLNKPGAAHTIAYGYMQSTNKPTLLVATPEILDHALYNEVNDIYTMGHFYNMLYVSQKSGINTINELSKKNEVIFGHGGIGSYSHIAMKIVCEKKLKCLDVPFKSAAEGMMALMSDNIDAYAMVSYGTKQFQTNDRVKSIYNINMDKHKSWLKVFGKNLSKDDEIAIKNVLNSQSKSFYEEMGLLK